MNLIVTSCSDAIWEAFGARWCTAIVERGEQAMVYVDDNIPTFDKIEFRQYPKEVDAYSSDPRFAQAKADQTLDYDRRYYRSHTKFWLRKVFAILDAACGLQDGDTLCWMDMDCMVANMEPMWSANDYDVALSMSRVVENTPPTTDTGLIFIRMSPQTRQLISKWAAIYSSGEVFKTDYWADNHTLDLLREELSGLKWVNLRNLNGSLSRNGVRLARHLKRHKKMRRLRNKGWIEQKETP